MFTLLRACRVLCHGEALRGVRSYSSSAAIGSNHRPVGALVEFTVHQVDPQLQANLRRQLRYSRARLPTTTCRSRSYCAIADARRVLGKCAKPSRRYQMGRITRQSQAATTRRNRDCGSGDGDAVMKHASQRDDWPFLRRLQKSAVPALRCSPYTTLRLCVYRYAYCTLQHL